MDDFESMAEARWKTTAKAVAQVARRAVYYDRDGIGIGFFNATDKSRNNVLSAREVMRLFDEARPAGCTPTYSRLQSLLALYLRRYVKDPGIKKYNIMILTDGEPDENVKNIKRLIVRIAKELDDAFAHVHQIGIRFVQIGTDPEATSFLKYIDDETEEAENLDRDVIATAISEPESCANHSLFQMIDTVRFDPDTADDNVFKKILLGAIHDHWDRQSASTATPPANFAQMASRPMPPLAPFMNELRTSATWCDV